MLEKLAASGGGDSFAGYALALEYGRVGRTDDALRAFEAVRSRDPDYLPMYLMAGRLLIDRGDPAAARGWLEQGAAVARRQGNAKALGEIGAALAEAGG